jgi:putative transposase
MGAPKRVRSDPTDDWQQLRLRVRFPEQEAYELLRPIVLFGQTAAERAQATGVSDRTLDRRADRFDAEGMITLFPNPARGDDDRRRVPADLRHRILTLKAEYPPFRSHEIAAICRRRDDCRVSHKTVQRILAEGPLPSLPERRYPPYAQIPDGVRRRLAVVHLYFEGWNVASIAGYLETTRTRVYETLHRFFAEDFAGLPDKSHAPKQPARKIDFRAMAAIRRLQANPELGEFRVHAALRQMGIHLSPRTCGRIMALNRQLGLPRPADPVPHEPRPMPFAATYRHEYWSVDVRYVEDHGLPDPKPVYVVSVLENYSRSLLATAISPRQDLTAYLIVLRAALAAHGSPLGIVSDGGGIFRAGQVLRIYRELGIERHQIEPGEPWQNYIETHFNVMRRMADQDYATATTWGELRAAHDRFFRNYNFQAHLAHQRRPDGRRSPADVLGWVQGAWCDEAELDRLFRLRSARVFDRSGYVRFRHWRVYGERGLAGRRGAVWVSGERLTVAFNEKALAEYQVGYAPETRRIEHLTDARLFATHHPSPQPFLSGLGEVAWHPAIRLRPYAPRPKRHPSDDQLRLML